MTPPDSPKLCRKCGNPEFIGGHGEWKQAIHKTVYGHDFEHAPKLEPTKCRHCGFGKIHPRHGYIEVKSVWEYVGFASHLFDPTPVAPNETRQVSRKEAIEIVQGIRENAERERKEYREREARQEAAFDDTPPTSPSVCPKCTGTAINYRPCPIHDAAPSVAQAPALKPCPFCGGEARYVELTTDGVVRVGCFSEKCDASPDITMTLKSEMWPDGKSFHYVVGETGKAAVEAWNRRTP